MPFRLHSDVTTLLRTALDRGQAEVTAYSCCKLHFSALVAWSNCLTCADNRQANLHSSSQPRFMARVTGPVSNIWASTTVAASLRDRAVLLLDAAKHPRRGALRGP